MSRAPHPLKPRGEELLQQGLTPKQVVEALGGEVSHDTVSGWQYRLRQRGAIIPAHDDEENWALVEKINEFRDRTGYIFSRPVYNGGDRQAPLPATIEREPSGIFIRTTQRWRRTRITSRIRALANEMGLPDAEIARRLIAVGLEFAERNRDALALKSDKRKSNR